MSDEMQHVYKKWDTLDGKKTMQPVPFLKVARLKLPRGDTFRRLWTCNCYYFYVLTGCAVKIIWYLIQSGGLA